MGNKTGNRRKVWTDREIAYLRQHYPTEPTVDVAAHLGITDGTVRKKAQELGIEKSPDYNPRVYTFRIVSQYKNKRYESYRRYKNGVK